MIPNSPFDTVAVFHVGPIAISNQVLTTWIIMGILVLGSAALTGGLARNSNKTQILLESVIVGIRDQIKEIIGADAVPFLPVLATLFLLITCDNLSSIVPGMKAPTASLETPAALAMVVYLSIHYYGITRNGLWAYLKAYAHPNILLLPLNILSEITRSFSLMVRLFGNMMSHEFVIGIVITLAGLFVPIPFMGLAILIGLIQAYIFTVLATVFLGGAVNAASTHNS